MDLMEEYIEYLKKLTKPPLREEWDFAYKLDKRTAQAIENLIKGYKELEEENRELRLDRRNLWSCIEAIKHTTPLNMVSNTDYYIQINDNFIPKSKIKEKAEEIDKVIPKAQGEELLILEAKKDFAQELLENN